MANYMEQQAHTYTHLLNDVCLQRRMLRHLTRAKSDVSAQLRYRYPSHKRAHTHTPTTHTHTQRLDKLIEGQLPFRGVVSLFRVPLTPCTPAG